MKRTFRDWYFNTPHSQLAEIKDKIIKAINPVNYQAGLERVNNMLRERVIVSPLEQGVINNIAGETLDYPRIDPKERKKRKKKQATTIDLFDTKKD